MKKIESKQKIAPFLWFNDNAEEAVNFYVSVFKNSRVISVMRDSTGGAVAKGGVLALTFELEGVEFMALNAGPQFSFTPAVSFFVHCSSQQEVDELWNKLLEGGKESRCGWLEDKYGLSWQIIPDMLGELMQDPDREKAARVMRAMMGMVKIDIEALERAAAGEEVVPE